MGTKVQCERLFPGHHHHHHSMRDLNNESNGCRWPLFYTDNKASANDQFYNDDKDVVRRTMLEHEAIFKAQVLELHRVYRIQKDMMDELKRKQFNKEWVLPNEASCSSQATTNDNDLRKWKTPPRFMDRPSMSVVEDSGHSPMKGSYSQGVVGPVPWQNGASSKNVELMEVRPTKMRRKMIDLCLPPPADDNEEVVEVKDHRQLPNGDVKNGYGSSSRSNGLADLNEPFKGQETNEFAYAPVISLHPNEKKVWSHQPLSIGKMIHQVVYADHNSATPFHQPAKPLDSSSQPMQVFMKSSQRGMGLGSKAVLWRERTFIDLEADTDTSHEVASHQPCHLFPPDSAVPWNHLHSSWQNPSFAFPQRVASAQRQGCLGDRLQFESNARYNQNMFYNECSSSSSKSKFSGTGYSYPNGGRSDYREGKPLLDSNGSEVKKFVRDLNLNVTLSSNTSIVEVRKDEENLTSLPWLVKPKSGCNSEVADDGRWNQKSNDAVQREAETEKNNTNSNIPRDESNAERDKVRMMLDINEPCEPLSADEEEPTGTKVSVTSKCHIDLNMSVSEEEEEDENCSVPTSSRLDSKRLMIDLETVPESDVEEDVDVSGDKPSEEFEKTAAETIVAISSACLDSELASSETIILHWFAETVENLDQKLASFSRNQARSIEEIDYFESMTLQLPEIREEEYMPKPLLPSDLILEETSAVTSHQRPRRGNARKAKQRRDFQRDILPGLLSLTKHEVTEDIHMFDGFMRAATGSSWTPARKKTGLRGRPRRVVTIPEPVYYPSVQQHVGNNGVIEDRSFAGWGKMTRRPRRQRCPSSTVTTTSNQRHAPFT